MTVVRMDVPLADRAEMGSLSDEAAAGALGQAIWPLAMVSAIVSPCPKIGIGALLCAGAVLGRLDGLPLDAALEIVRKAYGEDAAGARLRETVKSAIIAGALQFAASSPT